MQDSSEQKRQSSSIAVKVVLLICIIAAWVGLDQLVKAALVVLPQGTNAGTLIPGVIDIVLVHNTGAAWGIFAGNPWLLAAFSLVVCALLVVYFIVYVRELNYWQVAGIALIVAGGIGNAIDRFAQGFVTDFLCTTFIDFPVFNIADIGVTCGVPILLIGFFLAWRKGGAHHDD